MLNLTLHLLAVSYIDGQALRFGAYLERIDFGSRGDNLYPAQA